MFHFRRCPTWLLAWVAVLPLGCGQLQGQGSGSVPAYEPSADEIRTARELAERQLLGPESDITPQEKFYFIKAELLPDSQAETTQRLVMLTYYRYQGNLTYHTMVDLNAQQVVQSEGKVNFPCGLAPEEQQLAIDLARADQRLQPLFEQYGDRLEIQTRLSWEGESPTRPHRQVHLLFRIGSDYLTRPTVIVDLATSSVQVQ